MDLSIIKPRLSQFFDSFENELKIVSIGYQNFNFVKEWKHVQIRDTFVLHYVFEGSGQIIIDGKTYYIKSDEFFCVPKGLGVTYYPNDNDKWKYCWFDITGEKAKEFVESLGFFDTLPVLANPSPHLKDELYSMVKNLNTGKNLGYYKIKSLLYSIADCFFGGEIVSSNRSVAKDAEEIIRLSYHSKSFSIENLAESLCVSNSYLSKVFKKEFGDTPRNKLIEYRLTEAKKLLRETSLTSKEIGYSVGYGDEIHFLKEFKRKFLMTTKEYRNQNKNDITT